jgi:hypothetical protein
MRMKRKQLLSTGNVIVSLILLYCNWEWSLFFVVPLDLTMCFVELCNIVPTSCDIESVGPQVMARATIILAIIGSNNPEALSPEYV